MIQPLALVDAPLWSASSKTMALDGYALVTGAGSGLGRGISISFAQSGSAGIIFADMNLEAVAESAAIAKRQASNKFFRAITLQVNVTVQSEVDDMVSEAIKEFGRLDYAVNCAGIGVRTPAPIQEASVSEFERFMDVNVFGMFLCTRAQSAAMVKQDLKGEGVRSSRGVIINMGSAASFVSTPMLGQYTTSKHAVLGLSRNAALDLAPHSVRVNCVCPSWVDTPMVADAVAGNPGLGELMKNAIPMGRIAQVEEISDVVMFLCGPGASYVTGSSWVIDGGTTLSR